MVTAQQENTSKIHGKIDGQTPMTASPAPSHANLKLQRPIILVGLMGAGKSTVGRRLATTLNLPFIDSDNEIVEAAGCSIADIFETYGEAIFRDLEQRVLIRLVSNEPCVIATGGGAFINPMIREAIKDKGISIWLKASLNVLLDRVSRRDTRPLLKSGDKGIILQKLMEERYPVYEQADLVIDSDAGLHDVIVESILSALQERQSNAG
jgi:shikimate kinase